MPRNQTPARFSMDELGKYSKSFITNISADPSEELAKQFKDTILKYPEEGVYIYSFKEGRMLYTDGWEEVIGLPNEKITMLHIVNMSAPDFAPFVHEINDKALKFLHQRNERLKEYGFTIELKVMHKDGSEVPVVAKVSVHGTAENGKLESIMGRFQVNRSLRFGKVMRYAAHGPEKGAFEADLNESLFYQYHISKKELDALRLVSQGFAFKEIAVQCNVSQSAIEKRVIPMYKRFEVKSIAHLVSFAYENFLLP